MADPYHKAAMRKFREERDTPIQEGDRIKHPYRQQRKRRDKRPVRLLYRWTANMVRGKWKRWQTWSRYKDVETAEQVKNQLQRKYPDYYQFKVDDHGENHASKNTQTAKIHGNVQKPKDTT